MIKTAFTLFDLINCIPSIWFKKILFRAYYLNLPFKEERKKDKVGIFCENMIKGLNEMLPKIIIHNAQSLDGRIDWFTPDVGLYYEIATQFKEDATLVGSETILNPYEEVDIPEEDESAFEMPEKDPEDKRPILVIPDSRGRIRTWHYLRSLPYWSWWISLVSKKTPQDYLDYLKKRHIDYIAKGRDHVDMKAALEELGSRYGVKNIRMDSGGTLNGVLFRLGLVNEISIIVDPSLVGGTSPKSIFRAPDLKSAEGVIKLKLIHFEKMKNDNIWLRYEVL
jgi:2,5-diamino-6-(ribosylamino)-4(3H)-pyrimidinone 5'-phosphate reductase